MKLSKTPYKGTRDLFPPLKRAQQYLFDHMTQAAESFGYEPYDGPLLEEVQLYQAKSGDELINDQIYSFTDRGERFVAIRPEMTPTVARMVAQVHREVAKPIRWFSIPNLYRYERPQKGRLREHWQFNCDIFGAPATMGELEILQVAINLMQSFNANASHFNIFINDRGIVDYFFKEILKFEADKAQRLYKVIDKSKKLKDDALKTMIAELDSDPSIQEKIYNYLKLDSFDDLQQFFPESVTQELTTIHRYLNDLGMGQFLKYDPAIVRGLDYYTGIVFEIFDLNPANPRAICGGGAYAGLLDIFGEPTLPGVGFGLGDVTLKDFLTTHKLLPNFEIPTNDVFLAVLDECYLPIAFKWANRLRSAGVKTIVQFQAAKPKKVFQLAIKKGASWAGIIGEDEAKTAHLLSIKHTTQKNAAFELSESNANELLAHTRKLSKA